MWVLGGIDNGYWVRCLLCFYVSVEFVVWVVKFGSFRYFVMVICIVNNVSMSCKLYGGFVYERIMFVGIVIRW